jgi:hypothetical protein
MAMTSVEYLERATYCREQACAAIGDETRAGWLRLAEVWLQMASPGERRLTPEEFMRDLSVPKKDRHKDEPATS